MSEICAYQFPVTGQEVRTVARDGEPWFVARDVCSVLDIANGRDAVSRLDEDGVGSADIIDSMGRRQSAAVINESGLYELIFQSRKPEAKAFRRWVTQEVLPSIRRTGGYQAPTQMDELEVARRYVAALEDRKALEAKVAELAPDAARARQTMDTTGLSLVRAVAKRFGIKEKALREFLYAEHLLIRGGSSHNEPYARYVQSGHFELKTTLVEMDPDRPAESKSTTYVTPKGEALIWKRLYEAGYVQSSVMPAQQLELVAF